MVNRFVRTLIALAIILTPLVALAQSPACVDAKTRDAMRALMMQSLDRALELHIIQLFESWMKDATQQPDRASSGLTRAAHAYLYSRLAAQSWNPPLCK